MILMNKKILMVAVVLGVGLLGLVGYKAVAKRADSNGVGIVGGAKISKDKYQAVFLANDQVYFGKLKDLDSQYPVLEEVYYLVTAGTTGSANVGSEVLGEVDEGAEGLAVSPDAGVEEGFVLVRLGNEVHGPENKLVLNRDHILFVEDLKTEGKLTLAIQSAKELEAQGGEAQPESE